MTYVITQETGPYKYSPALTYAGHGGAREGAVLLARARGGTVGRKIESRIARGVRARVAVIAAARATRCTVGQRDGRAGDRYGPRKG